MQFGISCQREVNFRCVTIRVGRKIFVQLIVLFEIHACLFSVGGSTELKKYSTHSHTLSSLRLCYSQYSWLLSYLMHHRKGCEIFPQDGWQQFLVTLPTPPSFHLEKQGLDQNDQAQMSIVKKTLESIFESFSIFLCFVWCYRRSPSFHGNFAWCRSTNHLYVWDLPPFEWTFPKLPALHSLLLLPPFPNFLSPFYSTSLPLLHFPFFVLSYF